MTQALHGLRLAPHTVSKTFMDTVSRYGRREALRYLQRRNDDPQLAKTSNCFRQVSYTWEDYNREARSFAKALIAKNIRPKTAVTIQGSNSPQWLFTNVGSILAGGMAAGIYPTNSPELSKHAVKSSKAQVVVVEDENQLEKYIGLDPATPVKCFVVWQRQIKKLRSAQLPRPVYSWNEFIKEGRHVTDDDLDRRVEEQKPEQVCSLIYTSGTTGMPKAAALTHDNLMWTATALGRECSVHSGLRVISYLPLNHIAPLQLDCIVHLTFGYKVYIAPSDALKGNNLKKYLVEVRPTHFLGVPRVWEKFQEGIEEKVAVSPIGKRALFHVSKSIGYWVFNDLQSIQSSKPEKLTLLQRIRRATDIQVLSGLNRVIFFPIKAAMGLDACEMTANGAGSLDRRVIDFFKGLNIRVINLYGLSETSAASATPFDPHTPVGSCGKALPGTEIIIINKDENGEGEILLKGRHIFQKYWDDVEATGEAIDKDGYFHTGDRGRLDSNGYLFVTGRSKEVIKTSGGENISPIRIEDKIKKELPIVSQAVVIGNNRKFLSCLLTLRTETDSNGNPTKRLDKSVIKQLEALGSSATTLNQALEDEKLHEFIQSGITRANKHADSAAQRVQKFKILSEDFSVLNEMLTPTLKLKRKAIGIRYSTEIEAMYS